VEHWLNNPVEGGGRILGEACHMLDFANWLCGRPERVLAAALPPPPELRTPESATITLQYGDGSVGVIVYSGVGSPALPKERIEVLRGGWAWVLDDFGKLTSFAPSRDRTVESGREGKGHAELLQRAFAAARGREPFDPGLEAAYLAQSAALAAHEALASGGAVAVPGPAGSSSPRS
jgi:predicted dehydrogenase